jgi:hypothetical protein
VTLVVLFIPGGIVEAVRLGQQRLARVMGRTGQ